MELSARTIALRSALVASVLFILLALFESTFSWSLFLAGGLSLIVSSMLYSDQHAEQARVGAGASKPASDVQFASSMLLAGFPDPVVLIDRRGIVIHVNQAARALFPLLVDGRPLAFFVRAPAVLDGVEVVLNGGSPVDAEFREHGLVERTLLAHIAPLVAEEGGQPEAVMLVIRDLTSAKRLERMRVDFVANASHELRTPLASLIGFIETLQGAARNDAQARERFLVTMREQARRMARLIDDLLSLSRIEMHLHVPPYGRVEMRALVRHVMEALAPLAQERGVEVRLEEPEASLFVNGDRDELLRVVENLIENAIKYGQDGRYVDVSLQSLPSTERIEDEEVVMEVRDYGPGIAPEHLPRLTERFYRADIVESREKGGTGLGLAIVKHIVNRHRGRFDISSHQGEGALFRVVLPRIQNVTDQEMVR